MEILALLRRAITACGKVLKFGAAIQEPKRKELTRKLQKVCLNCEKAYGTVLKRLAPVKDAFQDPADLAKQLRKFAADTKTRDQFKPEHLCSEVSHILVELASNLDPLKYSLDFTRLGEIRRSLLQLENVDAAIYASYDEFTKQLDQLATQLRDPAFDVVERVRYTKAVIKDFEEELRSTMDEVRTTQKKILH
jgi:hypothetical protein